MIAGIFCLVDTQYAVLSLIWCQCQYTRWCVLAGLLIFHNHTKQFDSCDHFCRLRHLDMIKERAALSKDLDRRDNSSTVCAGSRSSSPTYLLFKQQLQQQHGSSLNQTASRSAKAASLQKSIPAINKQSMLNAAAPEFCPASRLRDCSTCDSQAHASLASVVGGSDSLVSEQQSFSDISSVCGSKDSRLGSRGSSPVPSNTAAAYPPPAVVLQQLKGNSQSIDQAGFMPAGSHKNSIKGARRRMAKCRRKLLEPG